ncbi:hypothetical protein R1sor_026550 [Riccia sorocarpa]|uniref:Uncharacterized protein n=1 Tax=Riccia sorocarpa TaxID=122646 RepID=A0ABD3GDE5_9MARC
MAEKVEMDLAPWPAQKRFNLYMENSEACTVYSGTSKQNGPRKWNLQRVWAVESIDHLFVQCPRLRKFWRGFYQLGMTPDNSLWSQMHSMGVLGIIEALAGKETWRTALWATIVELWRQIWLIRNHLVYEECRKDTTVWLCSRQALDKQIMVYRQFYEHRRGLEAAEKATCKWLLRFLPEGRETLLTRWMDSELRTSEPGIDTEETMMNDSSEEETRRTQQLPAESSSTSSSQIHDQHNTLPEQSARKLQESLNLVGQAVSQLLGATRGVDCHNNPIWQKDKKMQNLTLQEQEDTSTLQGKKLIYLLDETCNEDELEVGSEEEEARRQYQHFLSEKAQERAAEDQRKLKGIT